MAVRTDEVEHLWRRIADLEAEAIERVRARFGNAVPVTSGYVGRDLHESGELPASEAFLRKPWTILEFLTAVRGVLDNGPGKSSRPPRSP